MAFTGKPSCAPADRVEDDRILLFIALHDQN